jgi:hypothetical protein
MANCHFVLGSVKSMNDRVIESYEASYLSWFVDEHTHTHTRIHLNGIHCGIEIRTHMHECENIQWLECEM